MFVVTFDLLNERKKEREGPLPYWKWPFSNFFRIPYVCVLSMFRIKQLFKAPCWLQHFCLFLWSSREIHHKAFGTRSITDCKNFPGLHLKTSHRIIPMDRWDWCDRSPLPILCHGAEMRPAPSFAITALQRWDLSCSAWQPLTIHYQLLHLE